MLVFVDVVCSRWSSFLLLLLWWIGARAISDRKYWLGCVDVCCVELRAASCSGGGGGGGVDARESEGAGKGEGRSMGDTETGRQSMCLCVFVDGMDECRACMCSFVFRVWVCGFGWVGDGLCGGLSVWG